MAWLAKIFQLGKVSPVHNDILIAKMRPGQVKYEYCCVVLLTSPALVLITITSLGDRRSTSLCEGHWAGPCKIFTSW